MRKIAADACPQAMRDLIAISRDPNEDSRVRIVAIRTILERSLGKVREQDSEDKPTLEQLVIVSAAEAGGRRS